METLLGILSILLLLGIARSRCPNSCSGHGQCGVGNLCACYDGWTGGAADCSQRSCPNGTAWVDKAYATDSAHQLAECSNAGLCDRETGMCKCFAGFTGSACQRSFCPKGCSGHGFCSTIGDVAMYNGPDYDPSTSTSGDGYGAEYTNWDKDSIMLCECEEGFFGPDCSLVMCPKGDDPLTVNQNYRSIRMTLSTTRNYPNHVIVEWQGTRVKFPTPRTTTLTARTCGEVFSHVGKFGEVGCRPVYFSPELVYFDLTFYSWPTAPKDNNIFVNNGNPAASEFGCIIGALDTLNCQFSDLVTDNIREYALCSNRGKCDFRTGQCKCLDGFGGAACSNATFLYSIQSSTSPGMSVSVNSLNFTSSALQLNTLRAKSADFYFIEAVANDERLFYVQGDGSVGINSLRTLSGGHTVSGAGLYVEAGGCTIADAGLNIVSDAPGVSALRLTSTYSGAMTETFALLSLSSVASSPHYLIRGSHKGRVTFSVGSDGAVSIPYAGLYVSQGLSVYSGGLSVTGGATVLTGGMDVASGGVRVSGGLTIASGGLSVSAGGLQAYGGGSIYSGGLRVTGGLTINTGGIALTGGLSLLSGGMRLTGGLSVVSNGMVVTGGMTIRSGGMVVSSGGLTVSQNGMVISTGGMTVQSGGLQVAQGFTISTLGLTVQDGVTVNSNGIFVSGGGVSVTGGVVVNNGLTVFSNGAAVTGGFTVTAGGFDVSGALSVAGGLLDVNSGADITGGLTVGSNGVDITGGITTDSLDVLGSVTANGQVNVNTLVVTNGMTIYGAPRLESNPVIFSDRRLKTNLAPITDALEKVSKIKGVYFNWVDEEVSGMKMDRARHVGVLAQDVLRVLPEVVEDKHDKYLSVDYPAMIPLLIEAIRDLESLVMNLCAAPNKQAAATSTVSPSGLATLQAEVTALKQESADLEAEMRALQKSVLQLLAA